MLIQFVKTSTHAILPCPNGDRAMAIDLCSAHDYKLRPGMPPQLIDTGVVLAPISRNDTFGQQLSLRSGFALKTGCWMANGVGLIESSFAGFVKQDRVFGISVALLASFETSISAGDRIAQLLVYGNDGQLLMPKRDFDTSWSFDSDLSTDYDYWLNNVGPNSGGRGGFGSTDK
jgi:dUTPase